MRIEFYFDWVKFEMPVSKWTDESGNTDRIQDHDLSQVWKVLETMRLDDII